jgi:membrane-associated protease RseP (regulator of RpoE activity)
MNKIELKACAICVIAILCGCASSGTQVKDSQLSAFQIGVTTPADVIRALGPPQSATISSSGYRFLIYTGSHVSTKAATFIPIVGIFAGGATAQASSVIISFGRDGKMREITTSHTNIETGLGASTVRAAPSDFPTLSPPPPTVPPQTPSPPAAAAPTASVSIVPTAMPASGARCGSIGVDLTKLTSTGIGGMDGANGAMVSSVLPHSAAADAGIRQGDIVVRVGGTPINDPTDVQNAVCRAPSGDAVDVKLSRQAQPIWVSVRF